MSWYSGPALLDALNNVMSPKWPVDKSLCIPIQDVYGIGTISVGFVDTLPGMTIQFAPSGI